MFPELLRPHLTPRRVLAATAVLIGALLLLPWTPTYAPLREAMTQRHLEARGRTPAQMQAREAARRQAAEEEARRRAAEERQRAEQQRQAEQRRAQETAAAAQRQAQQDELRRQERELALLVAEFNRTADRLREDVNLYQVINLLADSMENLAHRSRTEPDFYRVHRITPEATVSGSACDDPIPASWDAHERHLQHHRNIIACAVYAATRPVNASPAMHQRVAAMALLHRIFYRPNEAVRTYTLAAILVYEWVGLYRSQLRQAEFAPTTLPPLTVGDSLNPVLFERMLNLSFSRRLIDTAITEEKLTLRDRIYPELRRLHDMAARILPACRALRRTNCLEAG